MALYIFSDAHLGADSTDQEAEKIVMISSLFELVKTDGDRLVILGDLFDYWFEYKHAIPKEHHKVLFMLSGLVERGIRIDYVRGNHDFWMGDFFDTQVGLTMHKGSLDLEYESQRLHLIHGDGLAPADRGYRVLKRILRNRFSIWLYRKLPPDWATSLAKAVSGSSRQYTSTREHKFAADYEAYAEAKLDSGFDIVAIGHLHIPSITKFENGVYVNTGDFINHFSYARLAGGEIKLEYLETMVGRAPNEAKRSERIVGRAPNEAKRSEKPDKNDYDDKFFVGVVNYDDGDLTADTLFHYRQEGSVVRGMFRGGNVVFGSLVAKVLPDGCLDMVWQYLNGDGEFRSGTCLSTPEVLPDGRYRLHESWRVTSGGATSGKSVIEEVHRRTSENSDWKM